MTALADPLRHLVRSPWPAWLVAAGAGLVCVWLLVRLLRLMVVGPEWPSPANSEAVQVADAAPTTSIASWRIFGQVDATAQAAPPTALALHLRGTVVAEAGQGLALIADAQGRERAYRVGDAVLDDAVLDEVHADRVVLRRAGGRETLRLRQVEGAQPGTVRQRPAPTADPSGGYLTGAMNFGAPDLATARAAQTPSLAAIAASANVLPAMENGEFVGVRLAVADPVLLERVGLHPDDIVIAVNGAAVADPEQRTALEAALRGSGPLVLTVRREGRDRQLTVRN